jgi:hypothetical protein
MALLDDGWTEEQAKGLLDALKLVGAIPNWKAEHLQRLYNWCSAHQQDHFGAALISRIIKPSKVNLNSWPMTFATLTKL